MARPRAHLSLSALSDAFAPDGFHGISAAELADALGVAKPTLYVHGVSKHSLFLRAVDAEVERVADRLHAADTASVVGRSAREGAAAAALALLEHAAARPAGAHLLAHTAHHQSSAVAGAVADALRRIPDRMAETLRRDLITDGLDPSLAPFLARAVHGAAVALSFPRPGERRPARAKLAHLAAGVVPAAPRPLSDEWPAG